MEKKKPVSLYLNDDIIRKVKMFCIEKRVPRVNDFYLEAIREKLERDGVK